MAIINLRKIGTRLTNYLSGNKGIQNAFNQAFYRYVGTGFTAYDTSGTSYVEHGFNTNPIVYAVISQMATKTMSVPFCVKRVEDQQAKKKLKTFQHYDFQTNPALYLQKLKMEDRAYQEEEMDMPIEKPNPYQNWNELFALAKVFLRTTGNVYFYQVFPDDGSNKGVPKQLYVLPSHLVSIVLKPNANIMLDENPVGHYMLIEGNTSIEFPGDSIIHIKLPNPNFGESGEHLYGQSPLRSALKNIQSSNEGLNQNVKMMKNSGSYGFISGKNVTLTPEQADQIKQRLTEMEADSSVLSNYAGVSVEVAFTRLNLTTEELRPFDYLEFDQKTICNVLGWSDKLLNNDAGAKYDNVNQFRKQVVTDNIIPDLTLIAEGLHSFLKRYPNYQSTELVFKANQLPEMQQDTEKLSQWMTNLLDRGVISRNEMRTALQFPELEDPEMEIHTVAMNIIPIQTALAVPEDIPNEEEETDTEGDDE
jgi:HK97 family phage portal protein